ncbi:hypothetical protein VPH35_105227 [Triticum aestivum]
MAASAPARSVNGFRQVLLQQVYLYVLDSPSTAPDAKYLYERVQLSSRACHQVPRRTVKFHKILSTATLDPNVYERCTTPGALGSIKFDYLHVYHYRRPKDVGVIKYLSELT